MVITELHVSDVDASVEFYSQLGLVPTARAPSWATLAIGDGELRLQSDGYVRSHDHYFTPHLDRRPRGIGVEICVEVTEPVDDVAARIRPGGAIVRELVNRDWGARDFRVADPDGYFVRVTTQLRRAGRARTAAAVTKQDAGMIARTVVVGSKDGLHARPAAAVVRAASGLNPPVRISRPGGEAVDARSILSVLGLDAHQGDEVVLSADGPGADAAVDAIADLVAAELDAPIHP